MSRVSEQRGLTVLVPVRDGEFDGLREVVSRLPTGPDSPFARVASTHFARFVTVASLLDGDAEPVGQRSYLLFTADFDVSPKRWLDEVAQAAGRELDEVLDHCDGYPGSADRGVFGAYLRRHDVGAGFSVVSYTATVERIRRGLTRQRDLRELAARAGALSAGALQSEWRRRFAG